MKFTNGNWLNREGVDIHSLVEVHEVVKEADSLTVYAPCKHIAHRGATLDGPLVTARYSSPMPGVIRVQYAHFKGLKPKMPQFVLNETDASPSIAETEEEAVLTSGELSVKINKGDWSVNFYHNDQRLTGSGTRSTAYIKEGQDAYMREQLDLSVGENVYGLGERFTPFVKNGQVVDSWNKDGGTSSEQAYKSIPFYITNKGYGVFVNHPELVSFEIGSERVSRSQFSVKGEELDYFIIDGPALKDVIRRYTDLTGKPALPPAWSFGLWLTTSFTTNYDEATVNHFVDGMAERDIPLRVFHFDCFWMKEFEWCNFEWDERMFPDPKGMLSRLKAKGLNICVWINPYIAQKSKLFDEAAENGYLIKRPNGDVWQWDLWQAGMGIVDFTNPDACKWFASKLQALIDMGVDAFKTDFGERIPTDVVYFDGSDPYKMHNYYTQLYNKVVFDLLKENFGEEKAVLFARSATAGGQQFPVHWGGDCSAKFESMAESLRGGLSLSLSGFGFWSHDIGGFEESSTPDVYKRWAAFGLLSSHSRLHGSSSYRVPWIYDDEAVDVLRHFTKLKYRLMPYLHGAARQAAETGIPVMRPMVLEFPEDPTCAYLDRQYMLGDSLLVAPVFSEDGYVSYYLPKGTWTHLLSGEKVEGGTWRNGQYDYMSLPLFVRENSVVAFGNVTDKPDYDYTEDVTFQVFELADGASVQTKVEAEEGNQTLTLTLTKNGDQVVAETSGSGSWSLLLRGISDVQSVENGSPIVETLGVKIKPKNGKVVIKGV
ncbi:alpha-xylosidase [Pullulanibacillus sp. KACC 23026]|uniref:alpha-xylosidase n=1 Tax=Pullulanibacillus sp. KACC 23026 TaxID=3028315 RepID=UPI0023B05B64|nr:alpha-xylosidase [Pullulanibacillus sp. KACC 23026]WEG13559.1 alpha-xylosidase [Pullulanibacillus sp. KACC 23026]